MRLNLHIMMIYPPEKSLPRGCVFRQGRAEAVRAFLRCAGTCLKIQFVIRVHHFNILLDLQVWLERHYRYTEKQDLSLVPQTLLPFPFWIDFFDRLVPLAKSTLGEIAHRLYFL